MPSDILSEANELKARILDEKSLKDRALLTFSDSFAIDKNLKYRAIALEMNYKRAVAPSDKASLESEILQLIDAIVADFDANSNSDRAREDREITHQIKAHFRNLQPPSEVVVRCEGLGKTFPRSHFTLKDISLTLRLGEITGVVGENANGKTTLFRILAGEIRQDRGSIHFPFASTKDVIDWVKAKQQMAYVPQELPRCYGSLEDNLRYEAAIHGITKADNDREVRYIVERLDLSEHMNKRWDELSGGYKLRFSLASALVWKPKLLLIDEPLANLDFKAQLVVLRDLRDLAKSLRYPICVVISSQHLHEVEAIADRILYLRAGEAKFNDAISMLGDERRFNTYELDTTTDRQVLETQLGDVALSVHDNGLSYVIKTNINVSAKDVLTQLLRQGVDVEYFRDISRSVKQLFSDNT